MVYILWSAYTTSLMAEDEYRNGRQMVYKLHAHLIFVTKYHKEVITDQVTDELRSAFEEVCGRHEVTLRHLRNRPRPRPPPRALPPQSRTLHIGHDPENHLDNASPRPTLAQSSPGL